MKRANPAYDRKPPGWTGKRDDDVWSRVRRDHTGFLCRVCGKESQGTLEHKHGCEVRTEQLEREVRNMALRVKVTGKRLKAEQDELARLEAALKEWTDGTGID